MHSRPRTSESILFALHFSLALVERNIPLDLVHAFQWLRVVPSCIFYFRLVGCDGVVACVAFVRTVCFSVCGGEVVAFDGVGWELGCVRGLKGNKVFGKESGCGT
jgi:hypothetical protein